MIYVVLFSRAFQIDDEVVSTIASVLMTAVGFFALWQVSRPFDKKRVLLLAGMILLYLLAVTVVPGLFGLHPLGFGGWLLLVVFLLLMPSLLFAFTRLTDFLYQGWGVARRILAHARQELKEARRHD